MRLAATRGLTSDLNYYLVLLLALSQVNFLFYLSVIQSIYLILDIMQFSRFILESKTPADSSSCSLGNDDRAELASLFYSYQ